MSLNRWVFKWRLNVEMLSHSLTSAGKEFQMDGAATEKAHRASSVCVRGMTSSGMQSPSWYVGLYLVTEIRRSDCNDHEKSEHTAFSKQELSYRKQIARQLQTLIIIP